MRSLAVKWLLLPAGMAALGYFVLAPKVSTFVPELKGASTPVSTQAPAASSLPEVAGPSVDVAVERAKPKATRRKRRHGAPARGPAPAAPMPKPSAPERSSGTTGDPGSSDPASAPEAGPLA